MVTDEHLRELFSQYGQLVHVKIPAGKRCGFVQFADRQVYLHYYHLSTLFKLTAAGHVMAFSFKTVLFVFLQKLCRGSIESVKWNSGGRTKYPAFMGT